MKASTFTAMVFGGIYELKRDDLKFCFPGESRHRPKKFDSREDLAGNWLLVLKREK